MNLEDMEMEELVANAKRMGIKKEAFKRQVVGMASTQDRNRGRTNASRHYKAVQLGATIDLLWDDVHPALEAETEFKEEFRRTWKDLARTTMWTLLFIILLAILLPMIN